MGTDPGSAGRIHRAPDEDAARLGHAAKVVAPGGQFQQNLPQGRTFQLLRLRMDDGSGLVPEISGNRLMMSVRMMRQGDDHRLHAAAEDAAFELTLCA